MGDIEPHIFNIGVPCEICVEEPKVGQSSILRSTCLIQYLYLSGMWFGWLQEAQRVDSSYHVEINVSVRRGVI